MFTGRSFSACLVCVPVRVSLADQPVSRSVAITNGDNSTTSSLASGFAGRGAVWAGSPPAARAVAQAASKARSSRRQEGRRVEFTGVLLKRVISKRDTETGGIFPGRRALLVISPPGNGWMGSVR